VVALAIFLAVCPDVRATESEDDARQHFEVGMRHYKVADWDAAIDEFKRAYELSPAPGLLFNIAQAYRAKKDGERALYFYTTYLHDDPLATEREYVQQRIDELRSADSQKAVVAAAQPAPGVESEPGRGLKVAGIVVAGGGLLLGGTSVFFGVKAANAASDVTDALQHGGKWTPEQQQAWSDGQRYQTTAWVLGAASVAAMATGGVLYYLGARRDRPVTLGAQVGQGGGSLTVKCAF